MVLRRRLGGALLLGHAIAWRSASAPTGAIIRRIAQIAASFDLQGIAFDRWRLEDLKKLLADEGIDIPVTPWGQGFKDMGPAVDALEAAILDRKLKHGAHPVLTWNRWNSVVEIDPTGARKIDKAKSTERCERNDGISDGCRPRRAHTESGAVRAPVNGPYGLSRTKPDHRV